MYYNDEVFTAWVDNPESVTVFDDYIEYFWISPYIDPEYPEQGRIVPWGITLRDYDKSVDENDTPNFSLANWASILFKFFYP